MNKKYALIINIAMLVVGLIGILIYFAINKKPVVVQAPPVVEQQVKEPEVIKENITVAVAKKDLIKGMRLTKGDYILKTISVPKGSDEKNCTM